MTARDDILSVYQRLAQAHHDKDAEAIADCYAPDALVYSLAPPLGERGMDPDGLNAWLATWDGPITIDGADADLVVGDDIAWTTALTRMRGAKTDGVEVDLWFRTTMCFRNGADGWRIVHDHSSVPFLMDGSERAALDLLP